MTDETVTAVILSLKAFKHLFQTLFQKFAEGQRNLAFEAEELETEKDKSAGQVRLILLSCLLTVKYLLHPVTKLDVLSE